MFVVDDGCGNSNATIELFLEFAELIIKGEPWYDGRTLPLADCDWDCE